MTTFCSSCKKQVTNQKGTASFSCPGCGKTDFVRCSSCRANAVRYTCTDCSFSGPN